jgi:CheY-like chemotaxis protein
VESGHAAIEVLRKEHFDVVLMDVQMPDMDGYQTTHHIRTEFESPKRDICVIALTASVLRHDIDRCLQAGMNSFIPKPFSATQLISGIARALRIELRQQSASKRESPISVSEKTPNALLINLTYLQGFCEGDALRMNKYINMFTSSVPGVIEKIQTALSANDFEEIANQIHSCRTKLVMMGMEATKEMSILIEKACRSHDESPKPVPDIRQFTEDLLQASKELNQQSTS